MDDSCSNGQLNLGDLTSSSAASLFTSLLRGEVQMQCLMHPHQRSTSLLVDRRVSQAVDIFLRTLDSPSPIDILGLRLPRLLIPRVVCKCPVGMISGRNLGGSRLDTF
ncbi:TPA: TetR/AcrR family transcriptional regulator C-terminal domain-containing protein [Pseudomonas aeruginosa]|nr:TetR/AcrR family transcriptional regulator C-terminal domain-containing protein [Pseudomonas aeruginosa]